MKEKFAVIALPFLLASILAAQAGTSASKSSTEAKPRTAAASALLTKLAYAEGAIEKRDWSTAERLLKEVIATGEQQARAWSDLGYVYHASGRREQAVEAYRKAVAADPKVFEPNLNLGLLLAGSSDPEAAMYLRAATQLRPTAKPQQQLAKAWFSLGRVLALQKEDAEATQALTQSLKLEPANVDARLQLGELLLRAKDLPGAEKEFQTAAAIAPGSADAQAALANFYLQTNRLPEAEASLRKFLAASPQSANGHLQLARVLIVGKRYEDAQPELQKALELHPGDSDALREMAGLQSSLKQYDAAASSYRTLVTQSPSDATLHHALATVLMRQKKWAEAQDELLKAVNLKPDLAEAYGDLAIVANENQNYTTALKALDYRAKYLPDSAGTYFLRATCFDHLKAFKEASENYKKFLAAADGKYPDEEWKARHRLIAIDPETRSKAKSK